MGSYYYDRAGNEITMLQWAALFEVNNEYHVVAQTQFTHALVSTVWLGLDFTLNRTGPPMIFETMVFCSDNGHPLDYSQQRYSTEVQALAGHDQWVALLAEEDVRHD